MKIRNFELKDQTVLEIGKFAILWNWFEKEFCNNKCNYRKLEKVVPDINMDFQCQKKLAEILEAAYEENALYPDNAKTSNTDLKEKKAIEGFLLQREEDRALGCLVSIYRVRCNMMHGLKVIWQLDEQHELFEAINKVLESIR